MAVAEHLQQQPESAAAGRRRRQPGVLGGGGEPRGRAAVALEEVEPQGLDRAREPTRPLGPSRRSASATRAAGRTRGSRPRTLSTRGVATGRSWSIAAAQPAPAGPSESAVARTSRCRAIAEPSGNGCARTAGLTQAMSSASSRIAGEPRSSARSRRNGRGRSPAASATELVAPPGRGACSSTVTSQPAAARWIAATSPLCPAPTIRTRTARAQPRKPRLRAVRVVPRGSRGRDPPAGRTGRSGRLCPCARPYPRERGATQPGKLRATVKGLRRRMLGDAAGSPHPVLPPRRARVRRPRELRLAARYRLRPNFPTRGLVGSLTVDKASAEHSHNGSASARTSGDGLRKQSVLSTAAPLDE